MRRVNPEMVRLAREMRGMTQEEMADRCGFHQAAISRIELGKRDASYELAERLSAGTEFPPAFFMQDEEYRGLGISVIYYRKRAGALQSYLKRLQAEVNLTRIHIKALLRDIDIRSQNEFQFIDITEHPFGASEIAHMVRSGWGLPDGPIGNLTRAIESAGGLVFRIPFGTRDVDAISQWPDDCPPLFFVNSQAPADRCRFSLAHEVGHMIMHNGITSSMEDEANQFAREILMPASEIRESLLGIDIPRAFRMKPRWGVSVAALIYRAHDLGCISKHKYHALFRRLSQLGYRKNEPHPIDPEQPAIVRRIIESYIHEAQLTTSDLARMTKCHEDEFVERYLGEGLRLAG